MHSTRGSLIQSKIDTTGKVQVSAHGEGLERSK
jgi:hypothetical protein